MNNLPHSVADFLAQEGAPKTCAHKDCPNPIRWSPRFKVWAKGFPKSSTPLAMTLSIAVCDAHRDFVNAENFWTQQGKNMVRDTLVVRGLAEPDFSSTVIEWVPLRSAL